MTINLSSYAAIESGLFVRMDCEYYRAQPNDTPTTNVFRFSNYNIPVTINSEVYSPLGQLMSISSTSSEIRNSTSGVTISVSGIPNTSIAEIVNSRIKGSAVQVWRMLFDPQTKQQLVISGNPAGRFRGFVNNYSIEEDYNSEDGIATNTLIFSCASTTEILTNKISGRRTNPIDQQALYAGDPSMDRVLNLAKSNFNFGAVIK